MAKSNTTTQPAGKSAPRRWRPARSRRDQNAQFIVASLIVSYLLLIGSTRAATLNEQLQRVAPEIFNYMNEKGYKNVGVLKFRIKKGDDPTTDGAGPLNKLAATRLEVALVLANPNVASRQVGIIRDASSVAAKLSGATHLTAAGRQRFFDTEYPLAWGGKTTQADAFLTGVILVDDDLAQMTVGILAFDRSGGPLERVVPVFKAESDTLALSEIGESFLVRGAFDSGTTQNTATKEKVAVKEAVKVKAQEASFPLSDSLAPVKLQIFYDNKLVSIEERDGKGFIPEPRSDQTVHFVLRRNDDSDKRYGVVLRVNGENTLFRQKLPDQMAMKWILDSNHSVTTIRGYQTKDQVAERFQVLSRADSNSRSVDYGDDVGQITVTVFQELSTDELPGGSPTDLLDEEEEDLLALTRGVFPETPPSNLFALKHQLRSGGNNNATTRGLIVQGRKTDFNIKRVTFSTDPTPVMSATITYYKP